MFMLYHSIMARKKQKSVYEMSDDELLDTYKFVLSNLNECERLNDDEGAWFYRVEYKFVMSALSRRNLVPFVHVMN